MPLWAAAFVIALGPIALASCAAPRPEPLQVVIDDLEAYQVYEQAIGALERSAIVLRRETTIGMPWTPAGLVCGPYLSSDHEAAWSPVLDDYVRQNGMTRT